ncbi:MAG: hypothetical protein JST92_03170 [Deltaproteobacteria bacterium]|nr:hypothetical protein [Deltaproteobacteria bacterium]
MRLMRVVVVALLAALSNAAFAQGDAKKADLGDFDLSKPAPKKKDSKAKPADAKPADPKASKAAPAKDAKAAAPAAAPATGPDGKPIQADPATKGALSGKDLPTLSGTPLASGGMELPDLLSENAKPTYQLGIYKLVHPGQPDDPVFDDIEKSLTAVAQVAPAIRSVVPMKTPKSCDLEDDACFALLGSLQQIDEVMVGALLKAENGLAVRVRVIDVQHQKRLSSAEQIVASTDPVEIRAWAESLACKLLVREGCMGEALIDLDLPEMQLIVDQSPLKRTGDGKAAEKIRLPVGVHKVRFTIGQSTSLERPLAILRDPQAGVALYGRQFDKGGLALLAPKDLPLDKDGKRKVPPSVRPKLAQAGVRWNKPVGFVLAGLGVVAAGVGGYEYMHAKGLVSDANDAYDKNGGYYLPAQVDQINSAKSAQGVSKVALGIGVGLIVVGGVIAFAF